MEDGIDLTFGLEDSEPEYLDEFRIPQRVSRDFLSGRKAGEAQGGRQWHVGWRRKSVPNRVIGFEPVAMRLAEKDL